MENILKTLISLVLIQKSLCDCIRLESDQYDKNLSETSTELLSSHSNCIVYILDWNLQNEYNSYTSTKYFLFYSNSINCALVVDTATQYRNKSTKNPRFENLSYTVEPTNPLFTKYITTLINLYPPATTSTALKMASATHDLYTVIVNYNIPLNFVLIFTTKEELFSSVNIFSFFTKFALISTPATYMLILDEAEVYIVAFAHAVQSLPFLFKIVNFQDNYIHQLKKTMLKDLQRATALLVGATSLESCTFGRLTFSHPHICVMNSIADHLNLTLSDLTHKGANVGMISVEHGMNTVMGSYLSRRRILNFDVVNHVIVYEERSFLCIAQVSTMGFMAFVKAFDLLTWLVTVAACMGVSTTLAAMTTETVASFWSKLQSTVPVILMLLIERFYQHTQVVRGASRQKVLVITLWAFGAMLLGMCYSGNMISQLTSPSLPPCPHDLEHLAKAVNYPILTDTLVRVDGMPTPLFHHEIDEYLVDYAHKHGTLVDTLRQFGKTLIYLNNSAKLIPSMANNTRSKILLAYAGTANQVSAYAMWSVMHHSRVRVLRGGNLPFFNLRIPVLVQTNFLGPILQRVLGEMFHSGIWKYWTDGYMAVRANRALVVLLEAQNQTLRKTWARKLNLATIWRDFSPLVGGASSLSALKLENLNAAFKFLGLCLLLALCAFIKERRLLQIVVHWFLKVTFAVLIAIGRGIHDLAIFLRKTGSWVKAAFNRKSTQ